MEETTENDAANKELEKTSVNDAANTESDRKTENDAANKEPEETTKNDAANKESDKIMENDAAGKVSGKITEDDVADKVSEKLDTEEDSPVSLGFHDFLEDDFLESLSVVDSWKAEDEETDPQENKEKVYSHSRPRPSRDWGDRKDRRSSERNRTDQHRPRRRSSNRGLSYRNDPYSRSRYSPSSRSGYNDRSLKDNRDPSRARSTTERYQRKSPDDVKSKRDQTKEHKPEAKIEDKARASSPCEMLVMTEEKAEDKVTQDDTASTSVPLPKLSSEPPVAIDTCIKEITDVVPPGTEEEFVNLSKNVGGKPQGFSDSEWNQRDLPRSEHRPVEKNGRRRSPTEYARRPSEREYKHGDYLKRYGSREREPFRRKRSRSKEMHLPRRSRSRERQTPTIKRRSRSRERQMPIKRRSRSRERPTPTTKARSRSRERQQPTIKARSRSRERQMPMKRRSRSRERQQPTIKARSRSRERQSPTVKRRSRSRERQAPTIKRRSRSRERQMPTVKRRSRSRERQMPPIKRRSESRERLLENQKKKLRKKIEKRSPSIKKLKSSWNPEKKAKGVSGRPYASKTKDSHKIIDPELSPVSGTSLSSPSLSLSPVSSDGERWRRRKSDHSPLSLSPARSYVSLSSEHSDRSPKRKRSPFWREIQRTFAAQDMAKSRFAKIPPPQQQQSYYQSKLPPVQPVSYPTELYPSSAPNYPTPTANYYQPPHVQPPPPGDFMAASATPSMMVPPVSAPMMVPPVSAPMMVPPVSTPMMVPPVTQMTPITYPPPPPCPVPPPVQPVASLQLEPPDPATWPQPVIEHAGAPEWVPEHGGTPNWEPEKPNSALTWEPKNNDGATKWEPEKYDPAKKWEPDKREPPSAPKWEPQKRGKSPKWKPEKHSGSSKREPMKCDEDKELIPPPPPTISQPEKSLSSLLEASAKAGVTQKKPSSVEHNVVSRCEEALRTLSAERGLVLPSSGNFVFHRDNVHPNPVFQESTSQFQSPLLRNPIPALDFTEPATSKRDSCGTVIQVKEEGEGKKSSMLVKAAAKLASMEMSAHPAALHGEVPLCLNCAEREKKKFVDCSSQTSVASRTVALQCDNVRGEIKTYFESQFDNNAPSGYRRYKPLPQPPKGILKSSRH